MGPLIAGVAVVLLFSISPIRSVNGLLCMGVVAGGYVAASLLAKSNGNRLETTRGLLLGARVGLVSAAIVIAFDLLIQWAPVSGEQLAGVDYLDPIPKYIYAAIYGIYDGLLDMVSRSEADNGLEWPGPIARYIILTASTFLFGAFGGAVAASTYVNQPSIEEQPERMPSTPMMTGHMRWNPGLPIEYNPIREATIVEPPPLPRQVQAPPAATGTHGYRVARPVFDVAAQAQAERRPVAPLSLEPASAARPVPSAAGRPARQPIGVWSEDELPEFEA